MFLAPEDIEALIGRKIKSKQIEQLREMELPFWINALGMPVVARATIEGRKEIVPIKKQWQPPG